MEDQIQELDPEIHEGFSGKFAVRAYRILLASVHDFNIQQGQHEKDWTLPTALEVFLTDKQPNPVQWLKDLIVEYESSKISLDDILGRIPSSCGWVHNALPQFKTFANQHCLLCFGFCPQYGEAIPAEGIASVIATPLTPFTDIVVSSVARIYGHTICLCARKDCRKAKKLERGSKTYRPCLPIGQSEAIWLYLASKLEVLIARKEYGIVFTGCIAFSAAAQDIAHFLDMKFWPVQDPSIIGRASLYSMWLASLGLKEIATKLAEILTGKAENLYEILRVDIIKARPKMKGLGSWFDENVLADERVLRRRSIIEAREENYVPRRQQQRGPVLQGPLTKKQLQNRKNHQSQAYKDAKKRHEQKRRVKDLHNARSRKTYQKVKASCEETRRSSSTTEGLSPTD